MQRPRKSRRVRDDRRARKYHAPHHARDAGRHAEGLFERVYVEIAEVKAEVVKCRADVAAADLIGKEVSVRLTQLEKRIKALEEARPEA